MDNRTKILIGVVFLLVIVFIVGTGLGLGNNQQGPISLDQPWVQGIGNSLAAPQALAAKDIQSASPPACLNGAQLVIPRGGTCTYAVASSSAATRRLAPQLTSGAAVAVALQQPANQNPRTPDEQVTLPPASGDPDHVDVYKEGGTLTVSCPSANSSPCRFSLAQ